MQVNVPHSKWGQEQDDEGGEQKCPNDMRATKAAWSASITGWGVEESSANSSKCTPTCFGKNRMKNQTKKAVYPMRWMGAAFVQE